MYPPELTGRRPGASATSLGGGGWDGASAGAAVGWETQPRASEARRALEKKFCGHRRGAGSPTRARGDILADTRVGVAGHAPEPLERLLRVRELDLRVGEVRVERRRARGWRRGGRAVRAHPARQPAPRHPRRSRSTLVRAIAERVNDAREGAACVCAWVSRAPKGVRAGATQARFAVAARRRPSQLPSETVFRT